MSLYDLTQAIRRYRTFLFIGFGVLIFLTLIAMFEVADGGIQWRGGLKYESDFQISVVAPGTASLNEPVTSDRLNNAAAGYADLLSSGEAAEAVGIAVGYELPEAISADVTDNAPIINASVIGPSVDEAKAATFAAFEWLAGKIEQPLDPQPPVEAAPVESDVVLTGRFSSTLSVVIGDGLESVDPDIVMLVRDAGDGTIAVAVSAQAGSIVTGGAVFEANGSLLLNLETASGDALDQIRLVPDPLPDTAPAYPRLRIDMPDGSIAAERVEDEDGDATTTWSFDPSLITTEWIAGTPDEVVDTETEQFQVAMLTENPTALSIGGRRGPLIGMSVLLVGSILLLVAVIVADTWRRQRDEEQVETGEIPDTPDEPIDEPTDVPIEVSVESSVDDILETEPEK